MDLSDIVDGMKPKKERQGPSPSSHGVSASATGAGPSTTAGKGPQPLPSSSSSQRCICDQCQRVFETRTAFDQHCAVFHRRSRVAAKRRDANYPCSYCGKTFTSPSKRTVHEDTTHRGLRPFKCEICFKAFGHKGDLSKHMVSHSGAKDYSCYICGQKFTRNYFVKRHIENIHEGKSAASKR